MISQNNFKPIKKITFQDRDFSLLLRPIEEKDAEAINDAVMVSIESFRPFMDWAHQELSVDTQIKRIRKSKESFSMGIELDFSVFDQNTGEFLMSATIGPSRIPNENCKAIGYWTSAKFCNQGLATLVTKFLTCISLSHGGHR